MNKVQSVAVWLAAAWILRACILGSIYIVVRTGGLLFEETTDRGRDTAGKEIFPAGVYSHPLPAYRIAALLAAGRIYGHAYKEGGKMQQRNV